MSRQAGSLSKTGDGWSARVRIGGRRLSYHVHARTEAEALARARVLSALAVRLDRGGHIVDGHRLLEMAGAATSVRSLDAVVRAVDALCSGRVAAAPRVMTFGDVAEAWVSGRLAEQYRDHVRAINQDDNRTRLARHVLPHIGDVPITHITLDHIETVMASLPARASQAQRRHVAQVMGRVLKLAVYPLKLIAVSPQPVGFLPRKPQPKAKSFLYPAEEAALQRCEAVPYRWRLYFGVLAREGMRRSEAARMTWSDLDLINGVIHLDRNKTADPRSWTLGDDVLACLRHERRQRRDEPATSRVFGGLDIGHTAPRLRAALAKAGVDRDKLYERDETRLRLRGHDLRSTFVTLALASGRTEAWVTDRTGHRSSTMIYTYKRAARSAAEARVGWLEPLDVLLGVVRE